MNETRDNALSELARADGQRASASLCAHGITKSFGGVPALSGVDLTVDGGETTVIIGASGSGKSTLLRVLAGLEHPESGEIEIDGEPFLRYVDGRRHRGPAYRAHRQQIGMVFQHFTLFPQLTVIQNVMLGPRKVLGVSKREAQSRASGVLARVGLADKEDSYPAHLSGGQQQRAAIARELAMERRIILFDEVTSALDPELVHEVLAVMRELAEMGLTMVVVTHEMTFAQHVAETVVFMDEGRIVEQATPDELFARPRSDRTREFLSKILT